MYVVGTHLEIYIVQSIPGNILTFKLILEYVFKFTEIILEYV